MSGTMTLTPGKVSLADLEILYWDSPAVALHADSRPGIDAAAGLIARAVLDGVPIYGVNTGFGKLANTAIQAADMASLQRNLILSHCCGVGVPIPCAITRLIMALKLISLGRGA
ncbi:uncharacterized protein METZ01_LOCUS186316, partial [marine metagenome]